jgi:mycothiol system anti-sigma-R factor
MSCGGSHETPCTEVLGAVYAYLDNEPVSVERDLIRLHLEECGPCCDEFDIEALLKKLVAKSLCGEPAPSQIRERIITQITQIQVEISKQTP